MTDVHRGDTIRLLDPESAFERAERSASENPRVLDQFDAYLRHADKAGQEFEVYSVKRRSEAIFAASAGSIKPKMSAEEKAGCLLFLPMFAVETIN